ncbi:MAG: GIY-YIG nuclease family protein [Bacteriovoracaceae bacterium]|nr:GIY-YIG nuclease family protein [Bacteriovoracaceae bacterium]
MNKTLLSASKTWWVYIVETDKGTLYTGITTDVKRRFRQHTGELKGGAKYFHSAQAVKIRFKKKFPNRSEASKFEAHVKSLTRAQKLKLLKA